ncbi:choloylglycine hydrolase [Limosilactobacillus sp.]|uniref:choloylglycine hydrolase n=1 Tax=Limosilactobacillus sp. TaxID=2773925 RepID=UPI00345E1F27
MCTSILYTAGDHYFGRNLDLEVSFGQEIVITPRDFPLPFRKISTINHHYAMTGMALVQDGYPLYFDGANEKGLGMAGLNFDGPAHYFPVEDGKKNVTPFEFIPYILGQCQDVAEAKELMKDLNLVDISFSDKFPLSPLHWLVADKTGAAIVVESTKSGLHVYDDPVKVLTNNPEFPAQFAKLADYAAVQPGIAENTLAPGVKLNSYSRGQGTAALPGGVDSSSRFVKVAFTLAHAPQGDNEVENVTNYFHCLHSVEQQKGVDEVAKDTYEYTIYSDGMNLTTGTFYYTTYNNNQINAVKMGEADRQGKELLTFPLADKQTINFQH